MHFDFIGLGVHYVYRFAGYGLISMIHIEFDLIFRLFAYRFLNEFTICLWVLNSSTFCTFLLGIRGALGGPRIGISGGAHKGNCALWRRAIKLQRLKRIVDAICLLVLEILLRHHRWHGPPFWKVIRAVRGLEYRSALGGSIWILGSIDFSENRPF